MQKTAYELRISDWSSDVCSSDLGFLEQADGAIDRRDGHAWIDGRGTFVQLFDIRVIGAVRQHARNHPALLGDAKAAFGPESSEERSVGEGGDRKCRSQRDEYHSEKTQR